MAPSARAPGASLRSRMPRPRSLDSRSISRRAGGGFLRAACSMVRRSCTDATVPAHMIGVS